MSKTFMTNEDMAVIDGKVDKLLQNASFRIEHGSEYGYEAITGGAKISIPCSPNPKLIIFKATLETQQKIAALASQSTNSHLFACIFNNIVDIDEAGATNGAQRNVAAYTYKAYEHATLGTVAVGDCDAAQLLNEGGVLAFRYAGVFYQGEDAEYEWTAYYWDE